MWMNTCSERSIFPESRPLPLQNPGYRPEMCLLRLTYFSWQEKLCIYRIYFLNGGLFLYTQHMWSLVLDISHRFIVLFWSDDQCIPSWFNCGCMERAIDMIHEVFNSSINFYGVIWFFVDLDPELQAGIQSDKTKSAT